MNYVNELNTSYYQYLEETISKKIDFLYEQITDARRQLTDHTDYVLTHISSNDAHLQGIPADKAEEIRKAKSIAEDQKDTLNLVISENTEEIEQILSGLAHSYVPQERIIALRAGYNQDELLDDPDPSVRIEIVKRNIDNGDLIKRYNHDKDKDVRAEVLKCNDEMNILELTFDDDAEIRAEAERRLEKLQAFNKLKPFDKLMLIAESMDWDVKVYNDPVHEPDRFYVELERYTDANYEISLSIVGSYKAPEDTFLAELNEVYVEYSPINEAVEWYHGDTHQSFDDVLSDMKEKDALMKSLADSLSDAYNHSNYDKYIQLGSISMDNIKAYAGKDNKSQAKNTIERD